MIKFRKVSEEHGWLSNMSPYKLIYKNKEFKTAEALFQSFRFNDERIIEEIRNCKSPMIVKMITKNYLNEMVIVPTSPEDVLNMEIVLKLKLECNQDLKFLLQQTLSEEIVEDVSSRMHGRNLFWGAGLKDGKWIGENTLGKLWMKIRKELFNVDS